MMIAAALLGLPGFVEAHGAESHPRLLARVEIAGMAWPRDALPGGLTLNRELDVIVPGEFVKVQAVGPYDAYGTIFGPRAVNASNGDYLVFGAHGGYYQMSDKPNNAPIIWRSTDQGRTWNEGVRPWVQDAAEHCLVPVLRHSDDNGHTWSAPTPIVPENDPTFPGAPIHMRGAVMPDGTWLWDSCHSGGATAGFCFTATSRANPRRCALDPRRPFLSGGPAVCRDQLQQVRPVLATVRRLIIKATWRLPGGWANR
jgi:hypothetical protein